MSRIIFLTSQKEIDLKEFGLNHLEKTNYLDKHFPYLKDKNYIYDLSEFNNSISYKDFVLKLIDFSKNENIITVAVLWQTEKEDEIEELNTFLYNSTQILSIDNYDKKYDLIYKFENDNFEVSSEFVIKTI